MLKDLSNYLQKKFENERQLAFIKKRVNEIQNITEEIETTNQKMANDLHTFQFESKYGEDLPDNQKRAIKLFELLETVRVESKDAIWTKDELDHYQVTYYLINNDGDVQDDLWYTTKQYEEHLYKEKTGADYEREKIINRYQRREEEIKDKASFYIKSLEVCLLSQIIVCRAL